MPPPLVGSCAQQLLAANAAEDVDQPDNYGAMPLYTACNQGKSDCVQMLLACAT